METGIVVTAATGVMSSLLSKLALLRSDQYKNLKGVRSDIVFLSRELTDMNAALVKLAYMEKLDVQMKAWRDKVREMAYDIEDCIDIFMHQLGEGDDKDGLFHKTAREIRKLWVCHQIASKIQELKAHVVELCERRFRYKIDESVSEPRIVKVDPRLLAMCKEDRPLVGIDGPREEIIKLLMEGDNNSGQLKVVSIVGFAGLGKTTLANEVYAKIKNVFECNAFVSVSSAPQMPMILKDILIQVGYASYGSIEMEGDVQKLIRILRAWIANKRYFVIIDDLWSIRVWDVIKCVFVENNNASRVIITTRNQDVGRACCIPSQGHVYPMQPLNEHDSRRLFFKRLFCTEDHLPEQLREILDVMLWRCKSVPLAIISFASSLDNCSRHTEIWEKLHNSLGSELGKDDIIHWVLSLSYNDLSHELKTCLLYLGTYCEHYEIPKEDLVRKWIAEGFVGEKHGLDVEEVAENCFSELIVRNMIQPVLHEDGSGEVSKCQVHGIMRDLILLKCKEQNFITIIDKKYPMNGASQVRRISHQFHDKDMPLTVESMSASTVRSYISFPMADCMPPLSKFEVLRVLDMEHSFSMDPMCLDLSAINHLFLLRYVRVQGFRLELPKKFGKLKHLMTLDISSSLMHGPSEGLLDFSSLSSLRHLRLNLSGRVAFKNGLRKLSNLRHLSCFDIGTNSIECIRDLGELTTLRNLELIYSSSEDGIENNPKTTILADSLNKLGNSNLHHLAFQVGPTATVPSAQFWSNCLARPRHLQRLGLCGIPIPKLPNWIEHADRLAHVVLRVQELRSDDVQVLGQLPCLNYLYLRAETIPERNIIIHPNTFHILRSFSFFWIGLPCLTFEAGAMPRLQRLEVQLDACGQGAMQLQEGSPVGGIEHLASLEKISLFIKTKYHQGSKIKSACRDAISRHPKSQAIEIYVSGFEYDENGNFLRTIRNTDEGTSGGAWSIGGIDGSA